jgi:hypothetical protein
MAADTQTDPPAATASERRPQLALSGERGLGSPLVLAGLVILLNALKPVVVDDAAYLAFARHIASQPLDPYGFSIFWYDVPQPAMEVLAPPVVPYWLAAGIARFGEQIALLKAWMFPFVWLLAWAVRELLRSFAPGTQGRVLPILVLSPAVLPSVNLMLDIPAFALGLAAVVVLLRAGANRSVGGAVRAGLVAALAMQTKYTMLLIPPVLLWWGWTHRRLRLALLSGAVAVAAFAGWEAVVWFSYGQSHFLLHAGSQSAGGGVLAQLRQKAELTPALVGHLGCLAAGVGLVAGAALGLRSTGLRVLAAAWLIGVLAILLLPYRWTVLVPRTPPAGTDTTAVMAFWQTWGTAILLGIGGCLGVLLVRGGTRWRLRRSPRTALLAGWLAIELAGYFVLTPFGAARRVIGVTVVGGFVAARLLSRVERLRPPGRLPGWVVGFGLVAGVTVAGLDLWDAFPEKFGAEQAAALAAQHAPGSPVWYVGHWGFQYYCERAGMQPLVPGQSVLRAGDVLVFPVSAEPHRFSRPHIAGGVLPPPADWAKPLGEVVWDDWLSGQTIPNFYGGIDPVVGRDHPRLRVVVYRLQRDWAVPR